MRVERPDQRQRLRHRLGLAFLGIHIVSPTMRPTLSVHNAPLPGVGRIRRIPVAQQRALKVAEKRLHMLVRPTRGVVEDDLVRLPVHRPEIRGAHLPRHHPAGFHGCLVHGDNAALQDMRGLRRAHRLQQIDGPTRPVRQTAPAYRRGVSRHEAGGRGVGRACAGAKWGRAPHGLAVLAVRRVPALLWLGTAVYAVVAAVKVVGAEAPPAVVFTLSTMSVRAGDADVYVLDRSEPLAAELGAGLPRDPERAEFEARRRLDSPRGRAMRDELARAMAGRALAGRLGVERLPAVVVDGRYVVYGVRDVERARDLVARWRADRRRP